MSSESITSRHEAFVCHLPFPSEYFPLIHEETDFSNLDINYLKDYYSRLNYDFLEINDEKILYKNITNPIGEEYYNIEFNFSSKTIKFNN